MGRWVTIMASGLMTAVARRWKGQINEIAKAGANFEFLPEADHNTLAGTMHPQEVLNASHHDAFPACAIRSSSQPSALGSDA